MPADRLADVFHHLDSDDNGFLDQQELKAAFEAVGQPATDATIAHSFSLIDADHDGKISLDEFKAMASQNLMPSLADVFARDLGHAFESNEEQKEFAVRRRDEKLAFDNPKAWCADRCLATGYCDVFEDVYDMTTAQVKKFCEACTGDADECELAYA